MTKILIADDNTQNLYLLETVLKGSDYEVTSAQDGAEALALALKNPPDLIITDILMPKMDGFELCRRCKADELLQQIPFIFYTATYTDLKDEQFALSLGADRFVIKPQQPEVLIQIVQEVLSKPLQEKQVSRKKPLGDDAEVLRQYNEVLFRKLERKMLQLADEIDKQKRTASMLRDSERKYRELFEQSRDAICITQRSGEFIDFNQSMLDLIGYTREEMANINVLDIYFDPACRSQFQKEIGEKGFVKDYEVKYRKKDGTEIDCLITATIQLADDGSIRGYHGIIRDVTEPKRAKKELEHSYANLQKAIQATIRAIALTNEIRDPYTAGHQQRVASIACAIAKELRFNDRQVEALNVAGLLHDIGKMYVPAEILSKPSKLNEIEMNLIRTHAQVGSDILETLELPWQISPIVLQHHERIDGSGYPAGISKEDITIEARVLAVADVVEAMSSHRPYRPALGIDQALKEIQQNKGKLYDTDVVDACVRLFNDKGFKLKEVSQTNISSSLI